MTISSERSTADPHQHIGTDTLLAQVVRQLIGAGIELCISQLAIAKHQRGRLGRARGLGLDQFMNALLDGIGLGGAVPVMHQHLLFIRRQHRQLADPLMSIDHHCLQQARPVLRHARDGRRVEQVAGVGQRGVQLAALFIGVEGQVELGGAPFPLDRAQHQAGGGADAWTCPRPAAGGCTSPGTAACG